MDLFNDTFIGNSAIMDGGSIYASINYNLTINNITINDSNCEGDGGAIYLSKFGYITIYDTYFMNNNAIKGNGGSIYANAFI